MATIPSKKATDANPLATPYVDLLGYWRKRRDDVSPVTVSAEETPHGWLVGIRMRPGA